MSLQLSLVRWWTHAASFFSQQRDFFPIATPLSSRRHLPPVRAFSNNVIVPEASPERSVHSRRRTWRRRRVEARVVFFLLFFFAFLTRNRKNFCVFFAFFPRRERREACIRTHTQSNGAVALGFALGLVSEPRFHGSFSSNIFLISGKNTVYFAREKTKLLSRRTTIT